MTPTANQVLAYLQGEHGDPMPAEAIQYDLAVIAKGNAETPLTIQEVRLALGELMSWKRAECLGTGWVSLVKPVEKQGGLFE